MLFAVISCGRTRWVLSQHRMSNYKYTRVEREAHIIFDDMRRTHTSPVEPYLGVKMRCTRWGKEQAVEVRDR